MPCSNARSCSSFSAVSSGCRRPGGELQQASNPIGVDADVAPGACETGRPAVGNAVPRPRHRRPAEIERATVLRAQRLDAARIEKFLQALNGRDRRRDVDERVLLQGGGDTADDRRRHQGLIALQIHDDVIGAESPWCATTSAMRSVPDACPAAVMTQSAPKPAATFSMRASSVATMTEAAPLARAHSHTHWISGRPPISSSGLPGRRVAAKRAGMTTWNTALDAPANDSATDRPRTTRALPPAASTEYRRAPHRRAGRGGR